MCTELVKVLCSESILALVTDRVHKIHILSPQTSIYFPIIKDAHKLFHEISKKGIEVNMNRLEELIDCFMTKSITFAHTFIDTSLETQSHKPLFVGS